MAVLRDPHAGTEIAAQWVGFLLNPPVKGRRDDVLEPLGAHS